jgi:hypothetical protein
MREPQGTSASSGKLHSYMVGGYVTGSPNRLFDVLGTRTIAFSRMQSIVC